MTSRVTSPEPDQKKIKKKKISTLQSKIESMDDQTKVKSAVKRSQTSIDTVPDSSLHEFTANTRVIFDKLTQLDKRMNIASPQPKRVTHMWKSGLRASKDSQVRSPSADPSQDFYRSKYHKLGKKYKSLKT
jgi:hypothetical protein